MNDPLGLFDDVSTGPDPLGLFDEESAPFDLKGAVKSGVMNSLPVRMAENLATLGTGTIGGVVGPLAGIADSISRGFPKDNQSDKVAGKVMQDLTYHPRGEAAQGDMESFGNFMNQVGIPLAGHGAAFVPPTRMPKVAKEPVQLRSVKDQIADLRPKDEVPAKAPIPLEAQMELPDSAMAVAPQYGIHEGIGRVDENGMPIRADLSMEAQNLQNPLQRNLWGDELPGRTGDGGLPLTQAIDKMPDTPWFGPRDEAIGQLQHDIPVDPATANAVGEANFGGLELPLPDKPTSGTGPPVMDSGLNSGMGRSQRGAFLFGKKPDTPKTPRSVDTITAKAELRSKVEASALLKKLAPEYSDITTPEEAIMAAKEYTKDINRNPVRDNLISGINAQVMNARDNPVMNFARYALQNARNASTEFSKTYVTSKTGVANTYAKMSATEKSHAVEMLREAAQQKLDLTPEVVAKLQLTEPQRAYINSVRTAMDAMWERANDYTMSQRGKPLTKVEGYLPAIFNGTYKSLVGIMKGGRFVTEAVIQADTKWSHDSVAKQYKAEGKHIVEQPRVGLSGSMHKSDLFSGFNDIINVLAKEDPRFADIQQLTNQRLNDANHKLMNFHVHELNKKGVKGALGDKPWLTREKNTAELGKAIIDYLEQGADYYSHQGALNDIGKVLTSADTAHLPNTKQVVANHIKHVTGHSLNPIGNALNYAIDALPKAMGLSHKLPIGTVRSVKNVMSLHLMGLWNPTFMALQWVQPLTGAIPEYAKIASKVGLTSAELTKTITTAPMHWSTLKLAKLKGWEVPSHVPKHLVEAFDWGQKHGIMDFSEMELAKNASRNRGVVAAENLAATPIRLGESFTRPPVFMTFVDMFHKFGLDNESSFRAAQHATNMAMGDYHPAERPKIYAQLGITGEFAGALTTYKHNMATQMYLHGRDAVTKDQAGKRQILPAAAVLGTSALLYGITGAPGYDDIDATYQWVTSKMGNRKTIRESALEELPEWSKSGLLSAATGLDFQSRSSNARMLPEVSGAALSPQLSALFDIIGKTADYAKYGDQASFNAMLRSATPSGMKGMVEDSLMTDEEGFVKNAAGEKMFDTPRTPKERTTRKVFGIKPLRESIEQKDVYADSQNVMEKEKKQKDIAKRFRQAWVSGDEKGMQALAQKFYDNEGSVEELLNSEAIQNQYIKSNQSQRDRLTGKLQSTLRSLNRWRDMHDGQ